MMPFYIKNVIKIVKIILVLEFFLDKTSAPVLQGYWIGNYNIFRVLTHIFIQILVSIMYFCVQVHSNHIFY